MNIGYLAIFLMAPLIAAIASGQTVQKPLSDKENPLLIGKRDLNTERTKFYSLNEEIALGRHFAVVFDREVRLIDDQLITEYINRVGQNIALRSDARMPFTIKIIDSDDLNSYVFPGGFLYLSREALESADSEAELAWVISHLIGHVAARHGLMKTMNPNLMNGLFIPISFLTFSPGAEEEADQLGAQYMWASGYNPQIPGDFLKKLRLKESSKPSAVPPSFFISKHVMTDDRIAKLNPLVARFPNRLESKPDSAEFRGIKARLMEILAEKSLADSSNTRPVLKRRQ